MDTAQPPPYARMAATCSVARPGHRYQALRALTYGVTLLVAIAIPTLHWVKLDIPGHTYYLWGEPVPVLRAVKAFMLLTVSVLLLVLGSTYPFGRMFCGWSCPGGQLARLARWLHHGWGRRHRLLRHPVALAVAFAFALIAVNWFTHLSVLWHPGEAGFAGAWGWTAGLTAVFYVEGLWLGFFWCERICPYGWYLGIMAQRNRLRVVFHDPEGLCGECAACAKACPVELDPRAPDFPAERCLTCGTCLDACDAIFARREGTPPLGWAHRLELRGPAAHPGPAPRG
ncbi:MAG: 4Fe-4S binding protein [Nitrospirae bacterium]|nr:MAG: 4Fe-4S binding protein [Nitrospirota bacterium]